MTNRIAIPDAPAHPHGTPYARPEILGHFIEWQQIPRHRPLETVIVLAPEWPFMAYCVEKLASEIQAMTKAYDDPSDRATFGDLFSGNA